MNPLLQYYFMIPLAGFLADSAIIILLLVNRSHKKYFWSLLWLYATLAFWNLGVMYLVLAQTESEAKFALYVLHHFIATVPVAFMRIALYASGRKPNWASAAANIWFVLILAIVEYSYWLTPNDTIFISGVARYNWGYYPVIGPGAAFYSLLTVFCVGMGFYYLHRPLQPGAFVKKVGLIFVLFWLGLITSHLPVFGIDVFPLGNATDAIISVFLAQVVFEKEAFKPSARKYLQWAGVLAAIAVAMIFSWFVTEFVVSVPQTLAVLLTVVSVVPAIVYFQRFFRAAGNRKAEAVSGDRPLFLQLQSDYTLTYQEATLCELLIAGCSRNEISRRMDISANTLKVHLSAVYRKTIDKENMVPSATREKLQRLTVFLHDLQKKIRETNT